MWTFLALSFTTAIITLIWLYSILSYDYITICLNKLLLNSWNVFQLFCHCKKPYFQHPDTWSIYLIILLELILVIGSVVFKK